MSTPSIFQEAYYQRLYDIEETHWWAQGLHSIMMTLLSAYLQWDSPLDILDVGCGTGYLLDVFKGVSPQSNVVGIDVSEHALHFCLQRGQTRIAIADAAQLPYRNAAFDVVVCIDTLQHLTPKGAPVQAMNDFARLLRPGGWLFLRTNSALGHPPLRGVDPDLYRRFHRRELCDMVSAAGLRVERSSYVNTLPALWGMVKEYRSSQKVETPALGPALSIQPYRHPTPTSQLLHGLMKTEGALIRSGITLGFGHSIVVLAQKPG